MEKRMNAGYAPMSEADWREWVRQAAKDMSISKKARDYWRDELRRLEAS